MRLLAKPSPQLAGNARSLHHASNTGPINRPTLAGPVQVDQMQIGRTLLHPAFGDQGGVGAEDRLLVKIALAQANALAAPQVDCRQNKHGGDPASRTMAEGPMSSTS